MALKVFSVSEAKVKLRYREPYVTDASNERALASPRGAYRGFLPRCSAVPDMTIWLAVDPLSNGNDLDSFAVYGNRNEGAPDNDGWSLSVREKTDVALDLSSSALDPIPAGVNYLYVYIDVDYQVGVTTTCDYVVSDEDPYNSGSSNYDMNVILVGRIPVTPAATTINFDITNSATYDSVVTDRKLPVATSNEDETTLAVGEERWGLASCVDKFSTPTTDQKKAMSAASPSPSDDNPFATEQYLWNYPKYVPEEISSVKVPPSSEKYRTMISSKMWSTAWGVVGDFNTISGGSTKQYVAMGTIFNSNNEPRLLVVDNTALKVEVWDPRDTSASSPESLSDALSDDLPTGSGQTWEARSMCTYGSDVYITFDDTNASPETHQIQAWDLDTWDVKSGWSSTGTALPGTGTGLAYVAMANATKIVTSNTWVTITAISSAALSVINMSNGTISASGAGDAPTGVSAESMSVPCSDGTNLYFVANASGVCYFCSSTIADPTSGCGGSNYPFTYPDAVYVKNIASCGGDSIVALTNAVGYSSETEGVIYTHNSSDADLDKINCGRNSATTPLDGQYWIWGAACGAIFDGMNLWALVNIGNVSGGACSALAKIDVAKLTFVATDYYRQIGDVTNSLFLVPYNEPVSIGGSSSVVMPMAFDGRDVWVVLEMDASQTYSGEIYRLPMAAIRY